MVVPPEEAARALTERAGRGALELSARRDELRGSAGQAVELLRSRFGATRVILFGSLAWEGFHAGSDVDLAAEGIPPEIADRAEAEVARLLCHPVELFRLEELPESFRLRVLTEGEVLP
ncbi:MAG: hypothetical protein AMXMBFR64_55250 [Myxococcales bacterium]